LFFPQALDGSVHGGVNLSAKLMPSDTTPSSSASGTPLKRRNNNQNSTNNLNRRAPQQQQQHPAMMHRGSPVLVGGRGSSVGGGGGGGGAEIDFPLRILVQSDMVGAIIGRGGQTIRNITQQTRWVFFKTLA
jgi:hypothetical protein